MTEVPRCVPTQNISHFNELREGFLECYFSGINASNFSTFFCCPRQISSYERLVVVTSENLYIHKFQYHQCRFILKNFYFVCIPEWLTKFVFGHVFSNRPLSAPLSSFWSLRQFTVYNRVNDWNKTIVPLCLKRPVCQLYHNQCYRQVLSSLIILVVLSSKFCFVCTPYNFVKSKL